MQSRLAFAPLIKIKSTDAPHSYVPFFGGSREFHPILGKLQPSLLVERIDRHFSLSEAFFDFIDEPALGHG